MKYFYVDANKQKAGPVSPEEFPSLGITEETLVWTKGMPQWTKAGQVPELADFFAAPEEQAGLEPEEEPMPVKEPTPKEEPMPVKEPEPIKEPRIAKEPEAKPVSSKQPTKPLKPKKKTNKTMVAVAILDVIMILWLLLWYVLNHIE